MKQEDWTSRLRERLEEHETPAPEGLWQQIEQSLPAERKAKVRPLRRWLAAAAAACHPAWAEDNGNTALTKDVKILYRIYRKKTPSDAI